MSDFPQAIQWLREGKKVRRNSIPNSEWFISLGTLDKKYYREFWNSGGKEYSLQLQDIEANDWEVYCKEHGWELANIVNVNDPLKETFTCKNCGIHKIKYKKQSLSDFAGLFSEGNIPTIHVKDKIQNAERRLKKEMTLTLPNMEIIVKVFREEFGKRFT